ncbi:hypothetical protein BTR23_10335 [Alkalihalophilus pseudofirmus]|uniref:enoyl-CoA hydratase/isomerase family protein n=1 Tax=Alkalihalobacterium alkalinitrilicum TaxID=427920 RepID=UPI00094C6828|nr:enoyl-CoA hydratase/isomerase family protein [Alkalihalobacterium alkalinitrilicum]OLO38935.1 hypothetical protein BTR23_10335 [Alkalihalophilus pseudofirmus]
MKQYSTLLVEKKDKTLMVQLNRPEKANAISTEMMEELLDVISELRYNSEIQYVVFTGAGKHFSGGADLSKLVRQYEAGEFTPSAARLNQMLGHEIMNKLEELEQVTIVAINGTCIGGGLALALACDFRIMTEEAIISIPEVARGIFFTWGSTPRLINIVGVAKAKELIMLCDPIEADEALRMNLVTKVVPKNMLLEEVNKIIGKLDSSPFMPIRMTKKIANAASIGVMRNVMNYDTELFEQSILSGEPITEMKKFVNRVRN